MGQCLLGGGEDAPFVARTDAAEHVRCHAARVCRERPHGELLPERLDFWCAADAQEPAMRERAKPPRREIAFRPRSHFVEQPSRKHARRRTQPAEQGMQAGRGIQARHGTEILAPTHRLSAAGWPQSVHPALVHDPSLRRAGRCYTPPAQWRSGWLPDRLPLSRSLCPSSRPRYPKPGRPCLPFLRPASRRSIPRARRSGERSDPSRCRRLRLLGSEPRPQLCGDAGCGDPGGERLAPGPPQARRLAPSLGPNLHRRCRDDRRPVDRRRGGRDARQRPLRSCPARAARRQARPGRETADAHGGRGTPPDRRGREATARPDGRSYLRLHGSGAPHP